MKNLNRTLLALCCVPAAAIAENTFSIPDFTASYSIFKGPLKAATANLSLKKNADGYIYRSVSRPAGVIATFRNDVITEKSLWSLDAGNRIRVRSYTYLHLTDNKRRKLKSIRFDWNNQTAASHYVKKQRAPDHKVYKIRPGTVDKFTLQLVMMRDMLSKGRLSSYAIADIGNLKHYRFELGGRHRTATPAGTFDTILIKKLRRNSKRITLMWCAPKLKYLPVKVQHIEKDGSKFRMVLTSVSGLK